MLPIPVRTESSPEAHPEGAWCLLPGGHREDVALPDFAVAAPTPREKGYPARRTHVIASAASALRQSSCSSGPRIIVFRRVDAAVICRCVIAGFCVAVAAVGCSTDSSSHGSTARDSSKGRWTALPRAIDCVVDRSADATDPDPPPSGRVERVNLSHDGGSRLSLALEFGDRVPDEPQAIAGPFGEVRGTPGSLSYTIVVRPLARDDGNALNISSPEPATNKGWEANLNGSDVLKSVAGSGRTLTVVVDFGGADDAFLDGGRFKMNVDITMMVRGASPLPTDPGGSYFVKSQLCDWDNVASSVKPSAKQPPSPTNQQAPGGAVAIPDQTTTDTAAGSDVEQYLAAAHQFLQNPGPPETLLLQLGRQVCEVRQSGGSSDEAEVAIWKAWNASGLGPPSGAETGSLVHIAIDNLCPGVGYP